jgi:ABC-type Fe3+-siderophore transport system permease subunit
MTKQNKIYFSIQPTTGRKFLWIVLGIIIVLILAAILFPTIIMLTREDETKSTGIVFELLRFLFIFI